MMVIEGNHEIEEDYEGNTFTAYKARYRVPHVESGSPSPLYYSFDYGGDLSFSTLLVLRLWSQSQLRTALSG